jgi:hypothetical protein
MIAMGIFTLVISLLWIFLTDVGFVSDFETFIGQDWQDYALSNPLEAGFVGKLDWLPSINWILFIQYATESVK